MKCSRLEAGEHTATLCEQEWYDDPGKLESSRLLQGLGILSMVTTVYSTHNSGLGSDDGSASTLLRWRFSPTLLVVSYNFLVSTLLQVIRRTESFARLAAAHSASATTTLCWPIQELPIFNPRFFLNQRTARPYQYTIPANTSQHTHDLTSFFVHIDSAHNPSSQIHLRPTEPQRTARLPDTV